MAKVGALGDLFAVVVALAVSGCVVGPFDDAYISAPAQEDSAFRLVESVGAATRGPDCTQVHNVTERLRILMGPTHTSGPNGRSGAEGSLAWSGDAQLLDAFQFDVHWTAASLLTKRLHLNLTYAPELKDLELEGASPLSGSIVVNGSFLSERPRVLVSPSTKEFAIATAGPEQAVEIELVQTFRRC